MKNTKTKLIALIFTAMCFAFNGVYAAGISGVEYNDANTLKVNFSEALSLGDTPTGEVKVLKDVAISTATKDPQNSKVINLGLDSEVKPNMSYSLIAIFGADGSMDFSLGNEITNMEIKNIDVESTIEKIVVVDSKRIDIYFRTDVTGTEFEFKILSSLGVAGLGTDMGGALLVKTQNTIEGNQDYILMVVSLKNENGVEVDITDGIYDFIIGEIAIPEVPQQVEIPEVSTPSVDQTPVVEENISQQDTTTEQVPENQGTDSQLSPENVENTVEDIALNAGSTPDTGAETWVLIFATLFINGFVYLYRRKTA